MAAMERFLLDANVFINAARDYYPFDLVPGFWACLQEHAATKRLQSIDRVRDELLRCKDDLADWAKSTFAGAFESTADPDVLATFAQIMTWVESQNQFMDAAKGQFADCADGWIVSYAKVNGLTVVTHEVYSREIRRKVPIPNVCRAFNVRYINTWAMLRALGVRLA